MFVISLSNAFLTINGIGVAGARLTWPTLNEAKDAADMLNAIHGLNAYVHHGHRTDLTVYMCNTHSFGYAK